MVSNKLPELLAPAGGMEELETALHFGADAIYSGLDKFGLRAFADNFTNETLPIALDKVHAKNKKFYLTLNAMPTDESIDEMIESAKFAYDCGVDAVIVSDLGVVAEIYKKIPNLKMHISTQANILNSATAKLYYDAFNVERVILARELSLEQIENMRKNLPSKLELETFIHGAMCMSYSGRCLLSSALTGHSANSGACKQSCRWRYALEEFKRPGEYMPIEEDSNGTYILSSYDLRMIDYLPELVNSGVSSLKIEGRMKSEYYVASVISTYRKGLDAVLKGGNAYSKLLPSLLDELNKVSHRSSNTGFFFGQPQPPAGAKGVTQSMEYIARIEKTADSDTETTVYLKNRFFVGDKLEVLSNNGVFEYIPQYITLAETGENVDWYGIAGTIILMKFPFPVERGDIIRGINRNHKTIIA